MASGRLPVAKVRHRLGLLGLLGPAVCLLLLRAAPSAAAALALVTLGASAGSLGAKAGWLSNVLDLAPDYAGHAMGVATLAGALPCAALVAATAAWPSLLTADGALSGASWLGALGGAAALGVAAALFSALGSVNVAVP